jgi:hypothetical protein
MKAISLWQPWATAVALGSKRIETRHWPTKYRGPLAIHAAKRQNRAELLEVQRSDVWMAALHEAFNGEIRFVWEVLPFGAIVATCELVDCRLTGAFTVSELDRARRADLGGWTERQMGNFAPGRYGWELNKVQPLAEPIPYRGLQGLFNVPDELLA